MATNEPIMLFRYEVIPASDLRVKDLSRLLRRHFILFVLAATILIIELATKSSYNGVYTIPVMFVSTTLVLPVWGIVAVKSFKNFNECEWCFTLFSLAHGFCTFWMILAVIGSILLLSSDDSSKNKAWNVALLVVYTTNAYVYARSTRLAYDILQGDAGDGTHPLSEADHFSNFTARRTRPSVPLEVRNIVCEVNPQPVVVVPSDIETLPSAPSIVEIGMVVSSPMQLDAQAAPSSVPIEDGVVMGIVIDNDLNGRP